GGSAKSKSERVKERMLEGWTSPCQEVAGPQVRAAPSPPPEGEQESLGTARRFLEGQNSPMPVSKPPAPADAPPQRAPGSGESAVQRALKKLGLVRDIDFALYLPLRYED